MPNFSEGRDPGVVDALGAALSTPARLLDVHVDADHNRSVFTLVGERRRSSSRRCWPGSRSRASGSTCAGTRARIHGSAPPTSCRSCRSRPDDMERARADGARARAERVGDELGLPVFLYGELGAGRGPAFFRRGGPEELQRRIDAGELEPDFGPARLDPSARAASSSARGGR